MKISPRELREAQIPSKAFGFNQDVVDALLERAADTIEGLIEENRQLFEALERLRSEGTAAAPIPDPFADVDMAAPAEPAPVVAPAAAAADIGASSEKEELINKTLLLAQRTADETLKTAKEQATEFVDVAKAKADELVKKATFDAETLTGEAQAQAQRDLETAKQEAEKLLVDARTQADELVSVAQAQADAIHEGEREKFVALVQQLTQERAQLVSDIEILQSFDNEHRTKLRAIVEDDLAKLVDRERIDIGALPPLPEVTTILNEPRPEPVVSTPEPPVFEAEIVETVVETYVEEPEAVPESFEQMFTPPSDVIAPASEEDGNSDSYDAGGITQGGGANFDADPFATFVDSGGVVGPAGEDSDAQVVEPAGSQVESSGSSGAFDPGAPKSFQGNLDDDDFFASLREAVQDDAPLGPSDDDDDEGGKPKGLFRR